jgi:putative phosphoesterase
MKILAVSDSHGDEEILKKVYRDHPGFDLYLHCGDFCLDHSANPGFLIVKGNCDFEDFPLKIDLPTKFGILHAEHGDGIYARSSSWIEKQGYFLYFYGHTHRKFAAKIGKTYLFNPGSLTRPRDGYLGSYLAVDVDETSGEVTYRFFDTER